MKTANTQLAFPRPYSFSEELGIGYVAVDGLSKRELIAAMAMQACISGPFRMKDVESTAANAVGVDAIFGPI